MKTPTPGTFRRWRRGLRAGVVTAATLIAGCRGSDSSLTDSPAVKSVVEGNTAFGLDLYGRLKDQPGNLFFSPYGISTSLAMTCAVARGRTESEMTQTLHFSLPQEEVHAAFGALAARVDKVRSRHRVALATANSLWCQADHHFTEAFLNLTRTGYRAEVRPVDFKNAAGSARSEIAAWVERKTEGRIKDFGGTSKFPPDTRLVLSNAIYFKGNWAVQFDPKNTSLAPFFTSPAISTRVPMMRQKSKFKTADADGVSLLELRYTGDDLSMIILLPQTADGLPDLESSLNSRSLRKWQDALAQATETELVVFLPRFKTTRSFELAKLLEGLGTRTAFDGTADFSGMTGTRDLFISDVVHQAFVEVNEEGTE